MIAPSLQWPTTISFANSLQLGFPDTDMPCGSHLQGTFITSWRLAMLAILAKEDSTVSSISCCLQMTHRIKTSVFQTTINRSSPMCQNISYLVYSVPTTFVRPESPWSQMSMGHLPQGCRDALLRCRVTHILSGQETLGRSRFHAEGNKAHCYAFQYKPRGRIPYYVMVLANG